MIPAPHRLILIAGPSGAGKTTLSESLRRFLPSCSSLSLDAYYRPLDHLPLEDRAGQNFDHPEALDWELLQTHVAALLRGEAVQQPRYSFDLHTRAAETDEVAPHDFLIVEGIHSFYSAAIRQAAALRIFVSAAETVCLERRLSRDQAERGRTAESIEAQFAATVRPMARRFVQPLEGLAQLQISGTEPVEQSVLRILIRLGLAS